MTERIKYQCFKCGRNYDFSELSEVQQKFENGSTKITYLCKECSEQ